MVRFRQSGQGSTGGRRVVSVAGNVPGLRAAGLDADHHQRLRRVATGGEQVA
jgi:hypothetical protein